MQKTYLLLGPEKGLRQEFIDDLRKQMGSHTVEKFYAFDDYEEQLFTQLENPDLFGDLKLVILDEAQEIKTKNKASSIASYIQNPSDGVVFLIMSPELYIHADIMAAVPDQKDCIRKFYEMFDSRKPQWLEDFFRSHGVKADGDAIRTVIERVDNNIQEFRTVCTQLCSYCTDVRQKNTVTSEDIEEFLSHTRQETEFTLFGYIARKKLESSLECLHSLLDSSDASQTLTVICTRLSVFFRRALSVSLLIQNGLSYDAAVKEKYFDTDRAITMPRDKDTYLSFVRLYNTKAIEKSLNLLASYDIKIKEGGTVIGRLLAERCIMEIIKTAG